jgi:hypothetical protein
VAALGGRENAESAAGLHGWHDAQDLAYVGWSTALIPGGSLRAEGTSIRRDRQRFRAGWIAAADLIADASLIVTRFTTPITSLALLIDDPAGAAAAQNLSLGLAGADLATDKAGVPLRPVVLVIGSRSVLIYAIKRRAGRDDSAVQVSVAREEGWRVSGVLASTGDADSLADRLLDDGFERAVRPLAEGQQGNVTLSWQPGRRGTTPPPTRPPVGRPPVTRPPAERTPARPKAKPKGKAAGKKKAKTVRRPKSKHK